jgi:hypothetical protein
MTETIDYEDIEVTLDGEPAITLLLRVEVEIEEVAVDHQAGYRDSRVGGQDIYADQITNADLLELYWWDEGDEWKERVLTPATKETNLPLWEAAERALSNRVVEENAAQPTTGYGAWL